MVKELKKEKKFICEPVEQILIKKLRIKFGIKNKNGL
jgi:hypothetical protein